MNAIKQGQELSKIKRLINDGADVDYCDDVS